jgi:hypothetical protein
MTVSHLDPKALRRMTPQQLADLALEAHRESKRLARLGRQDEAAEWDAEFERLCRVFQGEAA